MAQDGPDEPPASQETGRTDGNEAATPQGAPNSLPRPADGADKSIPVGEEPSDGSGGSDSSSAISLGTGRSGSVSEDWSIAEEIGDEAGLSGDHGAEDAEPPSVGAFEIPEGLVPDLDQEFAASEAVEGDTAGDDGDEIGSEFSEFAEIDNPEMAADLIGETSQDELPGSWGDEDPPEAMAEANGQSFPPHANHQGAVRVGLPPRPLRRRQAGGSIVGVIVGGLLAVPIVVVILLWGFRRDDFGIARLIPEQLAFLLPAEFQMPRLPRDLPSVEAMPRLPSDGFPGLGDDDPLGANGSLLPGGEATSSEGQKPLGMEPPAEDPLLDSADLALLEMATARANVMLDSLQELPTDAPDEMQKAARIDWYKSLAAVGEEAAAAEQVMVDGGRSAAAVARPVTSLVGRIAADPAAVKELAALARQWMLATKRTSPGVVIPGEFRAGRQIGSVWAATLQSEADDLQPSEVTVLSRSRPEVAEGSRVVAAGVIVAGDVIWASAWGPLDEQPADAQSDLPLMVE